MKKLKITAILLIIPFAINTFAIKEIREIDILKDRITKLETKKSMIELSGIIEVDYTKLNLVEKPSTDEITLTTIELEAEAIAKINKNFDAELILLYEQDENNNNIIVDIATLNGQTNDAHFSFSIGRQVVPFGTYATEAISDPIGLDIGETNDEALVISSNFIPNFSLAIWSINNLSENGGDNSGVSIKYTNDIFMLGVDAINKINENNKKGLALYGLINFNNWGFIAEQISTREGLNKIKATQLEVNYNIDNWTFAIVNNNLDNFTDYDRVSSFTINYELVTNANLKIEYKSQNKIDNTGKDKALTLKIAYEF